MSVIATGTGPLDNTICVTSDQLPEQCSYETTPSGGGAILNQNKTAHVEVGVETGYELLEERTVDASDARVVAAGHVSGCGAAVGDVK